MSGDLALRRRIAWGQTPETRIPDWGDGKEMIQKLGIVTLYPASPEIPNLFHAYVGDPDAQTTSQWDSPSGHVYTWRWELGRVEAGFYTAIVRNRPTFVAWPLLPAVLRLRGELRAADELANRGIISDRAYRLVQALEEAGGVLSTGELRARAGFPIGKEFRAAYLKAVDELDTRLMLAKVFQADSEDMSHALVAVRYAEHVDAAEQMRREDALRRLLCAYLPAAAYIIPGVFARHLKLEEREVREALEDMAAAGDVEPVSLDGVKGTSYTWRDV